jgi:hypothetical protein
MMAGLLSEAMAQYHLNAGLAIRKTEALYWENGVTAELSSDNLLNNQLVLQGTYVSSRFGNALFGNALSQDNLIFGARWIFSPEKKLRFDAGINTGLFVVDYNSDIFEDLPATSTLLAIEAGIRYSLKPVELRLSAGYNLKNGNGDNIPGTLFPVYYQFVVSYPLHWGE